MQREIVLPLGLLRTTVEWSAYRTENGARLERIDDGKVRVIEADGKTHEVAL